MFGKSSLRSLLHFAAVGDDDFRLRLSRIGAQLLDLFDDVHAVDDFSKNNVLAVEVGSLSRADKKLRAVSVGSGIGHAQRAWPSVLQSKVLIGELLTVNRFAARAVSRGEIAALAHKAGNHPMKGAALVRSD